MKKEVNSYYVYIITNKSLNKQYVGSRICYKGNPYDDGYMGSSKYLDLDISIYGIKNFSKEILQENYINTEDMLRGESYYMNEYNTFEPNGYNRYDPGKNPKWHMGGSHPSEETIFKRVLKTRGQKRSEETKQKMRNRKISQETKMKISKSNKGKKLSEEAKQKMSNSLKGRVVWNKGKINCYSKEILMKMKKPLSEETKQKMRKPKSPEHIEKLRITHLGTKQSKETILKRISKTRGLKRSEKFKEKLRHPKSEETKQKIRNSLTGVKHSKERNQKMKGKKRSEETKQKMRERKLSSETKQKISISNKGKTLGKKRSEETRQKIKDSWIKRKAKLIHIN